MLSGRVPSNSAPGGQPHESGRSSMHQQCCAGLTFITRCLMWAAVSLVSARVVPLSWTRSGMTLEAPSPAARPKAYLQGSLMCHGQSCRPQSPSRCFVASKLCTTGAGQAQLYMHVGELASAETQRLLAAPSMQDPLAGATQPGTSTCAANCVAGTVLCRRHRVRQILAPADPTSRKDCACLLPMPQGTDLQPAVKPTAHLC